LNAVGKKGAYALFLFHIEILLFNLILIAMKYDIDNLVIIEIDTRWSKCLVTFRVIDILPNNCYLLYAQNRIVVGQLLANNDWRLSKHVDVLDFVHDIGNCDIHKGY
jgi:hypothetical protein